MNGLDTLDVIGDDNCSGDHFNANHTNFVSFRINREGKKERKEKR